MRKNKVYMGLLHFPVGLSFEFQLKAADRETIEAVLNDLKDDPGKEQILRRRLKELAAGEEPVSHDLSCLITVPASDVNFQGALERADVATINAALAAIVGKPETKTKELALRRRLKKLIQSTTTDGGKDMRKLPEVPVSEAEKHDPALHMEMETLRAEREQRHAEEQAQSEQEANIARYYQAIGQIKTANMFAEFANVSLLVWVQEMRETKGYKDIPGVGTWEKFCLSIGCTRQHMEDQLKNLGTFGAKFTQTVCGLKVSHRDLRKLRQLAHDGTVTIDAECVRIGEEAIPLNEDHADELQAAIERIIEDKDKIGARVEKLEKQFEAAVKEETKGLKEEVKALVKEVKRLKPFDPAEMTDERFEEQFQAIREAHVATATLIGKLVIGADGLAENPELAARIEGIVAETEAQSALLRRQWAEAFQIY